MTSRGSSARREQRETEAFCRCSTPAGGAPRVAPGFVASYRNNVMAKQHARYSQPLEITQLLGGGAGSRTIPPRFRKVLASRGLGLQPLETVGDCSTHRVPPSSLSFRLWQQSLGNLTATEFSPCDDSQGTSSWGGANVWRRGAPPQVVACHTQRAREPGPVHAGNCTKLHPLKSRRSNDPDAPQSEARAS